MLSSDYPFKTIVKINMSLDLWKEEVINTMDLFIVLSLVICWCSQKKDTSGIIISLLSDNKLGHQPSLHLGILDWSNFGLLQKLVTLCSPDLFHLEISICHQWIYVWIIARTSDTFCLQICFIWTFVFAWYYIGTVEI